MWKKIQGTWKPKQTMANANLNLNPNIDHENKKHKICKTSNYEIVF